MSKYKTVVIDTIGEQARLYFSKAMNKHSDDTETIRGPQNYPGTTERLNIWIRRAEDLKKLGIQLVVIGHEQIDKIYAKGSMIPEKGQPPNEPIGVRGIPDLPGATFPEELLRKIDCIVRMRLVNGKPCWIAKEEPLGASISDAPWVAGCRFHAEHPAMKNGYLPCSWIEIEQLALAAMKSGAIDNWAPPYTWMIYGRVKIGKSRAVALTFPKPMKYFDFDHGLHVLGSPERIKEMGIDRVEYNVEESKDYDLFTKDFATCFA